MPVRRRPLFKTIIIREPKQTHRFIARAIFLLFGCVILGATVQAGEKRPKPSPQPPCDARFGHHLATMPKDTFHEFLPVGGEPRTLYEPQEVICLHREDLKRLWSGNTFNGRTIRFRKGKWAYFSPKNCADLGAIRAKGYYAAGNKSSPKPAPTKMAMTCGLLDQLKKARPPQRTYIGDLLTLALFRKLKATQLPYFDQIHNRPKNGGLDIAALERGGIVKFKAGPPNRISYVVMQNSKEGWRMNIFEVARSDIDHDGIQDVALLATYRHTKAEGAGSFLVWLTVRKMGGRPEIIDQGAIPSATTK